MPRDPATLDVFSVPYMRVAPNDLLHIVHELTNDLACEFMRTMGRIGLKKIVVTGRAALAMGLPVHPTECKVSRIYTACGIVELVAQALNLEP